MTQHEKELHLAPWCEIDGTCNGFVIGKDFTHIKINDDVICFQNETHEAAFLKQFLTNNIVGKKIAILRTDLPHKPVLIRLIDR